MTDSRTDNDFLIEANRILDVARSAGVNLRLMGAIAFRMRCPNGADLFAGSGRHLTDIDFASTAKDLNRVSRMFKELGYSPDERMTFLGEYGNQLIFNHPTSIHVDVFFDQLKMCQTIDFRKRLTVDQKTLPLSELLLEKMQIVQINRKDLVDTTILLLEHPVGDDDQKINARYISELLSEDWGFHHTFTTNLHNVRNFLNECDYLSEPEKKMVKTRSTLSLRKIEAHPRL